MNVWKYCRAKYQRLRQFIEHASYTPFTYPEYLRRCGARVGENCFIASTGMEIGIEPYLLKIGDRVVIERDVAALTHDGAAWVFRDQVSDLQVYGPVVIEDDCRIVRGSLLCPNVRIGRGSIVKPGSLVISNVPPTTIVAGVPARAITPLPPNRSEPK